MFIHKAGGMSKVISFYPLYLVNEYYVYTLLYRLEWPLVGGCFAFVKEPYQYFALRQCLRPKTRLRIRCVIIAVAGRLFVSGSGERGLPS